MKTAALAALLGSIALGRIANADVVASFEDGAPKDRFAIRYEGACDAGPLDIVIDLSTSVGRLIFDATEKGAGVEVFQPFELTAGADRVIEASPVRDGDQRITLTVSGLSDGDLVAFTIDVDDQLAQSPLGQIRVTGAEIEGATLSIRSGDLIAEAVFDSAAKAVAAFTPCVS